MKKKIYLMDFSCDRILQIIRKSTLISYLTMLKFVIIELSDTVGKVLHNLLTDYPNHNSALPMQIHEDSTHVK